MRANLQMHRSPNGEEDQVNAPTHPTTRGTTPAAAGILVSDAMHHGVLTCRRDTSLVDVADLMAKEHVHCVVVRDDDSDDPAAFWGIVSDLDLAAASSVRDLAEQTAGGTAATSALTVRPDETIQRAAQLMTEHATAHLIVVDEDRMPIGVISTLDLAAALGER
jgi:CBS domain-containing protein